MVPESFSLVLAACAPSVIAPRAACSSTWWRSVWGGVRQRRAKVAAAAAVVGWRHVSAFRRFFSRDEPLTILEAQWEELQRRGEWSLALIGPGARDEARPDRHRRSRTQARLRERDSVQPRGGCQAAGQG